MMYGGSDAAAHLGPSSGWPQGPGDGVRFQGLERRRRRRVERRRVPRLRAGRAAFCADRPRGVLRLPDQPAVHQLQRGRRAADLLADSRGLRGRARRARRAISCSCRESSRRCAGRRSARTSSTSPRRSACSSSSRSARCSATCPTPGRSRSPGTPPIRRWRSAPGCSCSSYEGPTGIVGVLHSACAQAGLPAASLWACVPHYAAAATSPKAALALVRRVEALIGVSVDVSELEAGLGGLRAPGRTRGAERPGDPGVRRTPRAGGRKRAAGLARERAVGRHARARIPALPAPARASSALALRDRAGEAVVAARAHRRARASARSAARGCPRRPASTMS